MQILLFEQETCQPVAHKILSCYFNVKQKIKEMWENFWAKVFNNDIKKVLIQSYSANLQHYQLQGHGLTIVFNQPQFVLMIFHNEKTNSHPKRPFLNL